MTSSFLPDGVFQTYGALVERLRESYAQLEKRARRIEEDLERVNAELALKVEELDASRSQLETVLDAVPVGIAVEDPEGRITKLNRFARAVLEKPEGNTEHGLRATDIVDGHGESLLAVHGEHGGAPHVLHLEDGTRRIVKHRHSSFENASGEHLGTVHVLSDETEAQELRDKVAHQETLAALGETVAQIAHEIRNPLNAVEGFAHLLKRRMQPAEESLPDEDAAKNSHYADRIVQGVREVDGIISNMLTFATSSEQLRMEPVVLTAVVLDAIEIAMGGMSEETRERYGFSVDLAEKNTRMEGDRIKLRQVFRNLVSNAMEAMPQGGRIRIRGRWDEERSFFRVTVEDEGPGVSPELERRLFGPFVTGKEGGTGLGLALAHRVMTAHGGSIELVPGKRGARFALRLPRHHREGVE